MEQNPLDIRATKRLYAALGLLVVGCAMLIIAAAHDPRAQAVFAMICTREGLALGHRDEALRKHVDDRVAATLRVYDRDVLGPAAAHIPKESERAAVWPRVQRPPGALLPNLTVAVPAWLIQ